MRRLLPWIVMVLALYLGSYLVLRCFVRPAGNLAFFAYPGPAIVDRCFYYGFWPVYKVDRLLSGRKHNFDRTRFLVPEPEAGV